MKFRVTRDGHVEIFLDSVWKRPTKKDLKGLHSQYRAQ